MTTSGTPALIATVPGIEPGNPSVLHVSSSQAGLASIRYGVSS